MSPRGLFKVSFRSRIALLFILLIAIVQGAAFFAVLVTVRHNIMARANEKLQSGARVFQQLVDDRGAQLLQNVRILAADFGFKQAVATGDTATIASALSNHGARVGAGVAMLVSLDGEVMASTLGPGAATRSFPYSQLLKRAEARGDAAGLVSLGGRAFQLVVVPVYAPLRVAWVAMGFKLNKQFAQSLQDLTHLNLSFVTLGLPAGSMRPVSTLPPAVLKALAARTLPRKHIDGVHIIRLNDEDWLTLSVPLLDGGRMRALLQTSSNAALAPYRQVRVRLIALSAGTLALFILGTILLARGVTRPVSELVSAAKRLGQGDYSEPVPVSSDELGQLATAFNQMQTAIGEREARIAHQAYHDSLTDLPGRNLAAARIGETMKDGRRAAILLMDIDRFKEINDTLGHQIGDQTLKTVAERLRHNVRDDDTVARLGGDEFMVLLMGADEAGARKVAEDLSRYIAEPVRLGDVTLYLELSVGIALFPDHGNEVEALMRRADIAMYDAKRARTGAMVYRPGRDERHLEQLALMSDFRRAVDENELRIHYQPKARLTDGEVAEVEALVRWEHPTRGEIQPDDFVPLAEQSGNIRWLTEWMLRSIVVQLREWSDAGIDLAVAMNFSAFDLMDPALAEHVESLLKLHEVAPQRLMFEITETAAMRDAPTAVALLRRLRRMGLRIAIDDFGTGYSSLSQLRRMPVDELKIDKSLVLNLKPDSDDAAIVRSAIELGHNMGLSVIAEGVETPESLAMLKQYHCDMAQGFLISRPLPAEDFMNWFMQYRRRSTPLST
ncbi:MAG TPA: EAL domain-containing protein [Gammaproteobacteria bacterium]|nr:EAL domain-containing protein [Gammaproteobacteria bacterium]